jgi:hypothetical protein
LASENPEELLKWNAGTSTSIASYVWGGWARFGLDRAEKGSPWIAGPENRSTRPRRRRLPNERLLTTSRERLSLFSIPAPRRSPCFSVGKPARPMVETARR